MMTHPVCQIDSCTKDYTKLHAVQKTDVSSDSQPDKQVPGNHVA